MELRYNVKTYMVHQTCDKCTTGRMINTGKGVTQLNTSWEHKCSNCGTIEWYDKHYPVIEQVEDGNFI